MFRFVLYACLVATVLGIYGGDHATIEEFPHQIHIRHFNRSICGGAIVNKNSIVTAAHCTDDLSAKYMTVRAGSDSKHEGGQIVKVAEIIQHEKYNRVNKNYDISILKLEQPLVFGTKIKAIPLQDGEVPAGTKALVSGWGATVEKHKTTPSTLRKVEVEVISTQDCKAHYKDNPVLETMLCATAEGRDSCKGDSGGPMIVNNKLIGLVSWGRGCGKMKFPGVYAKISALKPWILANANKPVTTLAADAA